MPPDPGLRDFKGRFRHDGVMRSDTSDAAAVADQFGTVREATAAQD